MPPSTAISDSFRHHGLEPSNDLFHARIHHLPFGEALAKVITDNDIGTVQAREKAEDAILQIQGVLIPGAKSQKY